MEDAVFTLARAFGILPAELEAKETAYGIAELWKSYLAHHPEYGENVVNHGAMHLG
jgi:hypothetical protein